MDLEQRSALGRKVPVGTYYNARTDTFLSESILKPNLPSEVMTIAEVNSVDVKFAYEETFEEKFEVMGIPPEQGVSILTDLTPVKGSSVYLIDRPNFRNMHAAVHCTRISIKETLALNNPTVKEYLAVNEISNDQVTHVVAAIEWGARSIIAARHPLGRGFNVQEAKDKFHYEIVAFLSAVEAFLQPVEHQNPPSMNTHLPMEITAYSDILDSDGILMQDLQEAYEFLEVMPLHIKGENNGKGLPIMYSLLPVGVLQFFLSPPLILSRTGKFVPPAVDCINGFVRLFSEFRTCGRSLAVLERKVQANEQYLPPNFLQQVLNRQQGHRTAVEQLKVHLAQNIQAVRGGSDPAALWTLLAEFQEGDLSPKSLGNLGASFRRSIDFITKAVSQGARYVGHNGLSLSRVLPQDPDSEAYVFFFTQHSMESDTWLGNQELLFELLNNRGPNVTIAIVDCEVTAINFDKVRIGLFQGGQEITQDYLEYKNFIADKCFALCDYEKVESKDIQKPIQRRHVTIACPGPKCTVAKIREWICPRCEAPVEFGFSDQYIYCDCGRSLYSNYLFKCNNDVHGPSYLPYDPKKLLQLLQGLLQSNYLNILILGETGVGKSTFINALVNYLEFDTLDEAMAADKLNYVIPCSFSTQLMDRENPDHPIVEKRIKIGARDDEKDGSTGDSATQRTTVYPVTFNMGDSIVTVRLIDTPGMGDTRGVDFDRQNMADILSTLSGYDELHGILILLKSNAARLTITFSYCVKELLTHLHHNASKNMAFGFTNTRISNYTPGDTYGPLKALLFQHPDIGLELKTPTTYCFDSESFRYLAAFKSDITMPNKLDFDRSWKHSRDESIRLINHFKSNPPHKVKNTLSLNGARQVISELTKPMAEITQVIESNIAITEDKVQELQDTRLSGDQLRNRLMVQKVQMKAVPLDMHRTVCGNGSCTDLRSDGKDDNTLVTVYKSHCHPICWLSDVPADQLAPPGLIKCAAFDGANCKECGHHWQEHLHVLYELVEETVTAKDNTIEVKLRSHANDVTLRETALAQHEQRISEYKQEREIIRDAAAKFGVFLRKYSLAPYNDALIAYMDYRIKEEQMKVQQGGNDKRLLSLTEERHKHKEAIEVIMRHMNSGANWDNLSEAAIDRMVNQLFNLKHFGSTLKNLKQGISTAHQSTYREISYTVRRKVPGKTIQKKPVPVSQAQMAHTHHMAQEIVQQTSPAYGRNYSHSHTHAKPENTSFVSRFRSMF